MKEDKIIEAFAKIKQDIDYLFQEIQGIKSDLKENKVSFNSIKRTFSDLKKTPTLQHNIPTPKPKIPTQNETPTLQHPLESQITPINDISIGNKGVPTNHPTNQPTNHPTLQHPPISTPTDKISQLQQVSKIIESLDTIKKDLRIKFKKLTKQEMLIFTTLFQLEEQGLQVDYNLISEKLHLSEISIRDYIRKIIKKDIPLDKIKEENNKIRLTIPLDLKKIASLNTIIQLREL